MNAETSPLPDEAQRQDARLARACLDLTSLGDADSLQSTQALCRKALAREPWPAAVCVWPEWVSTARKALPSAVRVAAVANFPQGGTDVAQARDQALRMADDGAQEVDLVLPWRSLLAGDAATARGVVQAVRQAVSGLTLKLIIESGELAQQSAIEEACRLGLGEGVDLLKTSTGKTPHGASAEAARWMLGCIAADARGAAHVGFKASGGVRTVADVAVYARLVSDILGPGALHPNRFRIGASALLDDIDARLGAPAGSLCTEQPSNAPAQTPTGPVPY